MSVFVDILPVLFATIYLLVTIYTTKNEDPIPTGISLIILGIIFILLMLRNLIIEVSEIITLLETLNKIGGQ